jgi:hypothetical protein
LQWRDVQGRHIILTAEKTEKRKRPISPTLRKMLDRRQLAPDGSKLSPDAHVFGNAVGEPVSIGESLVGRRRARRRRSRTCS